MIKWRNDSTLSTSQSFINWKGLSILLLILGIVSCCTFFYMSFISYPSTQVIATRYLEAIANSDLTSATNLVAPNKTCVSSLSESASNDIKHFGGTEIRNVSITVGAPPTSSELQFAHVQFDYRHPYQSKWQKGEIRLVTDHGVPGRRYLCSRIVK